MQHTSKKLSPSEFKHLDGIEYFDFEEDFIEKNIRCIPMIVRFNLDKVGVKLQLAQWCSFPVEERIELALRPCKNPDDTATYRRYLVALIRKYSQQEPTELPADMDPGRANSLQIPDILLGAVRGIHISISDLQWMELTDLQRFALLKLCRPGHENKNFVKALVEFGLVPAINISGSKATTNETIYDYKN
jgi:hypothetical protein